MGALMAIIYLAFVSLGLPDAVMGAAWPAMHADLGADEAGAGVLSVIVVAATIVVSFASGRLLRMWGTYRVCVVSVALTALSLVGFALAPGFGWLAALSVPLGLGAGAIDAALNSYAALYFSARAMNLLHASWGVGASTGPLVVAAALGLWGNWRPAYVVLALFQCAICLLLIITRRLWDVTPVRPDADAGADPGAGAGAGPEVPGTSCPVSGPGFWVSCVTAPWRPPPGCGRQRSWWRITERALKPPRLAPPPSTVA